MMDRREVRRYNLSLPAMIRVSAEEESAARHGRTRDISTRGVYLVVDRGVEAGVKLNLSVILAAGLPGGTEALVRAVVKVVRIEPCPEQGHGRVGLATVIVRYDIVRNQSLGS